MLPRIQSDEVTLAAQAATAAALPVGAATPSTTIHLHAGLCSTVQHHPPPCSTVQHCATLFTTVEHRATPSATV